MLERDTPRRYADIEERVSRLTLRVSVVALVFCVLVGALYLAGEAARGPFLSSVRTVAAWLVPLYALATLSGVVMGLYTAWGASRAEIQRRGFLSAAVAIASMLVLLGARALA